MPKKTSPINRTSTLFLRVAVGLIGLGIAALCGFLLPLIWQAAYIEYPQGGYAVRVIVAAMYLSTIPFYIGIYKGWQLLDAIDRGTAFSLASVKALQIISRCAGIISLIYIVCLPFFYIWVQKEDAPGLMIICTFFIVMSAIISVAVGILQRLLAEAVIAKNENDLTV